MKNATKKAAKAKKKAPAHWIDPAHRADSVDCGNHQWNSGPKRQPRHLPLHGPDNGFQRYTEHCHAGNVSSGAGSDGFELQQYHLDYRPNQASRRSTQRSGHWHLYREPAAMAPPIPARAGAVWDGRYRLGDTARVPPDTTLGALGGDAARLRRFSSLPAIVLRTMPAVRRGSTLLAVPHLHYPDDMGCACFPVLFSPPRPAIAAPFWFGDA